LLPGAFMSAWATTYPSPTHRYMRDSVDICDQGSFFVGGALKTTKYLGNSTPSAFFSSIVVGQMYVSFQTPKKSTGYPIIMISGGGHTGASLESTPNGDEGWAPYALRHGFPLSLWTKLDEDDRVSTRVQFMRARPDSWPMIPLAQL